MRDIAELLCPFCPNILYLYLFVSPPHPTTGLPLGCKSVSAGMYSSTLFAEPDYVPSAVPGSDAQEMKLTVAQDKADKVPADYAKKQPKPLLDTA